MDGQELDLKNRSVWMEGSYSSKPVNLKNARVIEGLSTLTETTIEFLSSNDELDMQDILGKEIHLGLKDAKDKDRFFSGTCTSVEYVGLYQGMSHFVAEVRPFLWFLTRTQENRIFQEKNVLTIIQEVMTKYGFWGDVDTKTTGTYAERLYCVQYRETDFAFISRLMEEEGIYYYFVQEGKKLKMILADDISAHKPTPGESTLEFQFKEATYRRKKDHIFDFAEGTGVTTGKITLEEYDFERPKAYMEKVKMIPKGEHKHKKYEHYRYPGHGRANDGTRDYFARVRMEAEAVKHKLSRGVGNVRSLGVGQTFTMKGHPRKGNNIEYLITRSVHLLQIDADYEDKETKKPLFDSTIPVDEDNKDTYRITFDVIPKAEPYRAPQITPWPTDMQMQTAVVTGPSGEEIHTDEYGRIKVQFFWDRHGKKDENTTCWVRCVMPWTGNKWGMISIPRIKQEVVIQFEEGDPDRPICTGMLYNADTMPPYDLPANKTQTGIKTRSSKDGSADNFNELRFEDKKGEEEIYFHAEKDYTQKVENDANITIGVDKAGPGNMTLTVENDLTETVNVGNHTRTISQGDQIFEVTEGNKSETIKGNVHWTVEQGNVTQTVKQGSVSCTVEQGNVTTELKTGSETRNLKMGNYSLKTNAGSIKQQAMQEIKLMVGNNSIKIDQSGVTIQGMTVKIIGTASADMQAAMTTVKGSGMLVLSGGLTKIN